MKAVVAALGEGPSRGLLRDRLIVCSTSPGHTLVLVLVLVSSPLNHPWRAAAWRGSGWLVRIRRGRQVDVMDSEPQWSHSVHSLSMLIKVDSQGSGPQPAPAKHSQY